MSNQNSAGTTGQNKTGFDSGDASIAGQTKDRNEQDWNNKSGQQISEGQRGSGTQEAEQKLDDPTMKRDTPDRDVAQA